MNRELEETLVRELREVADGTHVPPLPALPTGPHPRPVWQPLLVAAAVLLVVLGAVATVVNLRGDDRGIQPAPSPSPTQATESAGEDATETLATSPPAVPYVLNRRLYVAGERVPGEWTSVQGVDTGWIGIRFDGSYWWGFDAEPQRLEGTMAQAPAISPNGVYEARIVDDGGQGRLTGADTAPGGEGFGSTAVDLIDEQGVYTSVAAVTDDGLVITKGKGATLLWRPLVDGGTVDLSETAPDQVVLGNTPAGLLAIDGSDGAQLARDGEPYLAEIDQDGEISRLSYVPTNDSMVASEAWLAWVEPGRLGGEVGATDELQVMRVEGTDGATLTPPGGWAFSVETWMWEDADHLVAQVVKGNRQRMVRCSPTTQECVLLDTP